ncbi:hypothetical protein IC614_01460 [Allosphingosinicella flava]|uniref:Type II secretion system protein GspC N-terminal domain-containing protein n=1 Tax=Allosphingosinicella flava TaxID=2771430 RepID=A0A7T2GK31_9SPHN|nr:hypothetical protein [Sphingosinicella flava]QPQ55311.1 hypothetical protein IC614_01460 [Sphingosinicella flava]
MLSITNVRLAAASTPAEKRRQAAVLAGGGAVIAGLLAYLFWPDAEEAAVPAVEITAQAPITPPAPPQLAVAPPVPTAVPPADLSQYILFGVGGGGAKGRAAVIGLPGGGQRLLTAGRTLAPGITVKAVGADHAILATPTGDMRLDFNKPAQPVTQSQAAPAGTASTSAPVTVMPVARQEATTRYRLGLEPRKVGPNIVGYRVKSAAALPMLGTAGLQQGDILLSVNGEMLDSEERLHALAEQLTSAPMARLVFERDGQRASRDIRIR